MIASSQALRSCIRCEGLQCSTQMAKSLKRRGYTLPGQYLMSTVMNPVTKHDAKLTPGFSFNFSLFAIFT